MQKYNIAMFCHSSPAIQCFALPFSEQTTFAPMFKAMATVSICASPSKQ